MPFGAVSLLHHVQSPGSNVPSPFRTQMGNTPASLEMMTPPSLGSSPTNSIALPQVRGHLSQAVQDRRTKLFLEGKISELLGSMSNSERSSVKLRRRGPQADLCHSDVSRFLYSFWHYAFAAAQSWSPRSGSLTANELGSMNRSNAELKEQCTVIGSFGAIHEIDPNMISISPQTCRWSIHMSNPFAVFAMTETEAARSTQEYAPAEGFPLGDQLRRILVEDVLPEASSSNLIVPLTTLASKTYHSNFDLIGETISFAIMGGNLSLLRSVLSQFRDVLDEILELDSGQDLRKVMDDAGVNLTTLLHLATSYLDGGNTCCLMLNALLAAETPFDFADPHFINVAGHTLIDSLLLVILRSHTNVPLNTVDSQLGRSARYSGQEVDICGRWTATSDCYKTLLASGHTQIPWAWKHKFCRTSAQAICHSLRLMILFPPFEDTTQRPVRQTLC